MMTSLYDSVNQDFPLSWDIEMFDFHPEMAALSDIDMAEIWADVNIQHEALGLDIVPPAGGLMEEEAVTVDWSIRQLDPEPVPEPEPEPEIIPTEKLVHHDCMWAGSCVDSVHPGSNTFVPLEPVVATAGQSLLRRPASPTRPETPPSLDEDEPPEFRHAVDVAGTAQRLLRDSAAVAADHSYTLAKPAVTKHRFESLGVQTPSDSEEEIDVVSLGDKCGQQPLSSGRTESLPRVPSAQDRHHIQRTITTAITPRPAARKRLTPPSSVSSPRKRTRGAGRPARRSPTDSESEQEQPELERRSLHNDMERMRRIGLKNLFDQLKYQVPSTKLKERAPKVVILREAANLCRSLQQEEQDREQLKRKQSKLMAKLKKLRLQLASRYS